MKRTRFEGAEPILSIADMRRSLQYYVDVLGFTNAEWGGTDFHAREPGQCRNLPE